MLTLMPALQTTVPVAIDLLFPVAVSVLVVVMLAVFTNVVPEVSVAFNVPVKMMVPPLPAGRDPILKFVAFNETCPFMVSTMVTLFAIFPPLFP